MRWISKGWVLPSEMISPTETPWFSFPHDADWKNEPWYAVSVMWSAFSAEKQFDPSMVLTFTSLPERD